MSRLWRYMFDLEQKEKQRREDARKRGLEGNVKGPDTSPSAEDAQIFTFSTQNWLRIWKRCFRGQQWGFVAFRAACHIGSYDDEDRWASFKAQFQRIVGLPFERALARAKEEDATIPEDFEEAGARFTIQREDTPAEQESTAATPNSDSLRSQNAALRRELNSGLLWDAFLCASEEAVESFEKEATNTNETKSLWRPGPPFLLAIAADKDAGLEHGHEESIWLKPVLKVAAEALVESLTDVVDMDTPLQRVTRNVREANEPDEAT